VADLTHPNFLVHHKLIFAKHETHLSRKGAMHFLAQLSSYEIETSLQVMKYLALLLLKQADGEKCIVPIRKLWLTITQSDSLYNASMHYVVQVVSPRQEGNRRPSKTGCWGVAYPPVRNRACF
jgi:hypothetical protein